MRTQRHEGVAQQSEPVRSRTPFARWPVLLGMSDAIAVLLAAYLCPGIPLVLRALFVLAVPVLLAASGMYTRRLRIEALDQAGLTLLIVTVGAMAVIALNFMVLTLPLTPAAVARLWVISLGTVLIGRALVVPLYRAILRSVPKRRTLIIGSGMAAMLVADKIDRHPELDLQVIGFVDEGPRKTVRGRSEPLLGAISELTTIIEQQHIEVAILGYTVNNTKDILGALYLVEPKVDVLMLPRYFEFVSAGMKVDDLAGLPLLRLNRRAPSTPEVIAKRAEDIVLGSLFSLIVLPLVPLVAIAIKLDSPGPIIFKHKRVGKNGRPFDLYKFRSMRIDADLDVEALDRLADQDPRALKNRVDVRMTRVGYYLRKFSIDELPQLFNVLKGDMSLVGPRPPVAEEVAAYEEWQKKRLAISPGITGIWQVNGRSDLPFDERVWLDFMYIDSWSVWLDLRIIMQTIPAVLSSKGAY